MTSIRTGNKRAKRPIRMTGVKWNKYNKRNKPSLHQGVLIRMIFAGPVYDVACYTGRSDDGSDRWILSDITLDADRITHWAIINDVIS